MMVVALDDGMLRLLTNFWRTDEEEKAVDDDRLDPSGSCAGPASLGGPNTRLEVTEEDKSSLSVAMDLARAESVLRATEGNAVRVAEAWCSALRRSRPRSRLAGDERVPLPTRVLLLLREAAEVCLERECGSVVLALAAALDVMGSSETDLSVTNAGSGLETLVVGRRVIAADRAMAGRGVRVV